MRKTTAFGCRFNPALADFTGYFTLTGIDENHKVRLTDGSSQFRRELMSAEYLHAWDTESSL